MGIKELGKPNYKDCAHCIPKKGCGIYQDRPEECREFNCLWLGGILPRDYRPDVLGVMFCVEDGYLMLYETKPNGMNDRAKEVALKLPSPGRREIILVPLGTKIGSDVKLKQIDGRLYRAT